MRKALGKDVLHGVYRRLARRYDVQHALLTARSDQRGRRLLIEKSVRKGDNVLDCGAGTGTTGLMAAQKVGPQGRVTLFDLSEDMLAVAREKAARAGVLDRVTFVVGDMERLPFDNDRFDAALSTYSLCPLGDPAQGARELVRVTRPGGMIGAAHSATPRAPFLLWLSERVEKVAWRMPWLSMGCRAVDVAPTLEAMGVEIVFSRTIGVPLWPFHVFIARKPAFNAPSEIFPK